MKRDAIVFCVITLLIAGCGGSTYLSKNDPAAKKSMQHADSLVNASALHDAAVEYATFAEQFPASSYYKSAVRNAAFYHCDPLNSQTDENASLYWFQVYHDLGISGEEKYQVETYISLLKRNLALRTKLARKTADLEQQVKFANDELKKLKDVDVKIQERKAKK